MTKGERLLREFVGCLLRGAPTSLSGSDPNEAYGREVTHDKAYRKRSVYVPDEDKDEIDDWLSDMGLASRRKHVRSK